MTNTIDYYNRNAEVFVQGTVAADFSKVQERFLLYVPEGGRVLDFGCGSGRDTKYFLERGYEVDAIDGSEELCRMASEYTGIQVRRMMFTELDAVGMYDGIWACASILHLTRVEMSGVLSRMAVALRDKGVIYTSYKYGEFEGERGGRHFTDFTVESLREYIQGVPGLLMEECWVTADVRPGRDEEKWVNAILRREER